MQNPVVEFVKENSSRESEAVRRNLEAAKNQAAIDAARKEQLLQARLKSKEQADQRARIVEQKLVQRVEALDKAKAGTKVSPLNFNQPSADKSQRISIQTNQPSLKAPLNFDIRNMRRPEAAPPNAIQISKQTALPQSSQSVAQPQIPASFKRAPLVIPPQPPRDAAAQNVIDKRNYVSQPTSSSPISGFIGPKTVSTKTYSESKNDYNPASKLPFDFVFMYSGTAASIADIPAEYGTFALMNGTDNSVGNGGSGIDLSGRFIVCIGTASGSEPDKTTYALGDTGGYQHHGNGTAGNINNHTDHDLAHYHTFPVGTGTSQCASNSSADVYAWATNPTGTYCITSDAVWNGPGANVPNGSGVIDHTMTDNRPPYYALCFIERIA